MKKNNHKLYLGMFSFQVKKRGTNDSDLVTVNNFLSEAYPNVSNKFSKGFVSDILNLIDQKVFKTKEKTHGGLLEEKTISSKHRYFDVLINGGITGIEQFLIDSKGNKETIDKENTVGLKFYARFWLPAGGKTFYLFIQHYSSSRLKPLFDELIHNVLKKHGFSIATRGNKAKASTTKKRLQAFLNSSVLRDITVVSKKSKHDTGIGDAESVIIRLKKIKPLKDEPINKRTITDAAANHGVNIDDRDDRDYEITATYINRDTLEERTAKLASDENNINIIPSIILPQECIDENGYPEFKKVQAFVDNEIEQVKEEAKMP